MQKSRDPFHSSQDGPPHLSQHDPKSGDDHEATSEIRQPALILWFAMTEVFYTGLLFSPAHMENADIGSIHSVVDPARANPYLTIQGMRELRHWSAHESKTLQVVGDCEDLLNNGLGRFWLVERNVFSNRIELNQRRIRPDYFSHLRRRFLASACDAVRPSRIACSPRAIPSRTDNLRFISS